MFQCSVVLCACFSFGILIHSRILIWQLYWWWSWSPQSQILFMEYILHQGRLLKSYQEVGFISVQYPPQATTWLLSTAGAFRGCQAQLDGEGFDGRGGKTFESSGRITPGISQCLSKYILIKSNKLIAIKLRVGEMIPSQRNEAEWSKMPQVIQLRCNERCDGQSFLDVFVTCTSRVHESLPSHWPSVL